MREHRPSPWVRHANSIKSRSANCVVVRLPAYTDCVGDESPEQIARWDADARIIPAAPELLEELEELADFFDAMVDGEYTPDGFTTQPARAAIAKARGVDK